MSITVGLTIIVFESVTTTMVIVFSIDDTVMIIMCQLRFSLVLINVVIVVFEATTMMIIL